jgi:hypothetical protein
MLATFGLERLESRLTRDAVSAEDVDEFLHQAGVRDVGARPADSALRRHRDREPVAETYSFNGDSADLPTRLYVPHRPNPQFHATPHANRV